MTIIITLIWDTQFIRTMKLKVTYEVHCHIGYDGLIAGHAQFAQ